MEQGSKKTIMLGVIMVCLVLAGVIAYKTTQSRKINLEQFEGMNTWVQCRNPACKHEYQMPLVDYYKYIEEHRDPTTLATPPLTCEKCGEPSAYRAIKCPKCGFFYEDGSVPRGDFSDRCPKCSYSQEEENRKAAAEARRGGE